MKKITLCCILLLSGCLQEPATIEGINNYTLPDNSTRRNYKEQKQNYVFEDEKIITTEERLDIFDPYQNSRQLDAIKEFDLKNTSDINFNQPIAPIQKELTTDWDNLFKEKENAKINLPKPQASTNQANAKPQANSIIPPPSKLSSLKAKPSDQDLQTKPIIKPVADPKKIINQPKALNQFEKIGYINKPANGLITTEYGKSQDSELNDGIGIKVSGNNNIVASGNGKIIYLDGESNNQSSRKVIVIKQDNGLVTSYAYEGLIKTRQNQEVKSGQIIGKIDEVRNFLYFTARHNGKTIDPKKIMNPVDFAITNK